MKTELELILEWLNSLPKETFEQYKNISGEELLEQYNKNKKQEKEK